MQCIKGNRAMTDAGGAKFAAMLRTYIRWCFSYAFPGSIKIAGFWHLLFAAGILGSFAVLWKDRFRDKLVILDGTWGEILLGLVYILMACSAILLLRMIFVSPYRLYCELKEQVARNKFPLYTILRMREDRYRIVLAVAGFTADEITITEQDNQLTILGQKDEQPFDSGKDNDNADHGNPSFFGESFERRFNLADNVEVKGASFENGLLQIDVHELLDARKPRRITIKTELIAGSSHPPKVIEHPKVA